MKTTRFLIALLLLTITIPALAKETRRRGNPLRDEIISTQKEATFSVVLLPNTAFLPTFKFQIQEKITEKCVRIYETLLEIVKGNTSGEIRQEGNVEYVRLPNEPTRGEEFENIRFEDKAPLANTIVHINGKEYRTDPQGLVVDARQVILDAFDNLRTREIVLNIEIKNYGKQELHITRDLIATNRSSVPGMKRFISMDLLQNMQLNFTQLKHSSTSGLQSRLIIPDMGNTGTFVPVTVEVKNKGPLPASNLIARTFSSTGALDGKTFYFGQVKPGTKVTFTRMVQMPDRKQSHFIRVAFWSARGAAPEAAIDYTLQ